MLDNVNVTLSIMAATVGIFGLLTGVIGLTVGGIAYATISDSDNAIDGCYGDSNGQLRVIDDGRASCKNNGPHGLCDRRDAEHVGGLAHPPEILDQFRHAAVRVRTPRSA